MVEDEAQEFVAENIELAPIAVEPFVSEDAELEEEMTVQSGNQQKEMEEGSFSSMKYAADEKSSIEKDAVAKSKLSNTSALKKSGKKRRSKNVSSAPVMVDAVMELKSKDNNNADQKLLIIEGYKAVNYLKEYQEVYDDENVKILESNSVSAGYENKLDKENAEKAKEEMTVEVTYRETLEKAIHLYKVKSYRAAISEFDNILAKHPKDVNAQFYSGLCYFHLPQLATALTMFNTVLKNKETEFNEEASWYKALILIEIKNINGAKKLLNNIIEKGGFYKVKAEEKLKEL